MNTIIFVLLIIGLLPSLVQAEDSASGDYRSDLGPGELDMIVDFSELDNLASSGRVDISQYGDLNYSASVQKGSELGLSMSQSGNQNKVTVTQLGEDQSAQIQQEGDENQANLYQNGYGIVSMFSNRD